jgi:hypothetical protein
MRALTAWSISVGDEWNLLRDSKTQRASIPAGFLNADRTELVAQLFLLFGSDIETFAERDDVGVGDGLLRVLDSRYLRSLPTELLRELLAGDVGRVAEQPQLVTEGKPAWVDFVVLGESHVHGAESHTEQRRSWGFHSKSQGTDS